MFRTCTDVTRTALPTDSDEEVDEIDDKKYICGICTDGWTSETEVVIHRANTHKKYMDELYKQETVCHMCMKECDSTDEVLRHIKSDHLLSSETATRVEREIFICSACDIIFFNKLLLIHHIQYSHMPRTHYTRYKCPVCYRYVRLNISWYHFRMHKLQSIACCMICLKKFKNRHRLALHMKTHPRHYKCDMCGYWSKNKEFYQDHLNSVHKTVFLDHGTVNNYESYYIPREYPKTWKILSLMGWRGRKLTNNVHICILCREICKDDRDMKYHIMHHIDQSPQTNSYLCSCGMTFFNKVLLKHHKFKFGCSVENRSEPK